MTTSAPLIASSISATFTPAFFALSQDAMASADAARAGTYRLDDGALVERLDEGVELAAIAGELDGVSVLGDVDDAPAEDVRHALHVLALLLPGAHLDEHQLALDVLG